MADKPDLEKLKSKLDLSSILDSVKSIINPASGTPDVDPDDDLGVKIAQISVLLKEMATAQEEHVKHLKKVNELLNGAFQDVESLRKELQEDRAKKADVKADVKVDAKQSEPVAAKSQNENVSSEQSRVADKPAEESKADEEVSKPPKTDG